MPDSGGGIDGDDDEPNPRRIDPKRHSRVYGMHGGRAEPYTGQASQQCFESSGRHCDRYAGRVTGPAPKRYRRAQAPPRFVVRDRKKPRS